MSEVSIRPLRPADRERVLEMVADVWDGEDYIPRVFDAWIADPAASFTGAELDGLLVGIQRVAPVAPGLDYLEGLRVASSHRRHGIARELLRHAIGEARAGGRRVLRLLSANPHAIRLFESEGFVRRTTIASGIAPAFEGGDPPRLGRPDEAERLFAIAEAGAAHAAYGGLLLQPGPPLDMDVAVMRSLCEAGRVRVNGRAVGVVGRGWSDRLSISYLVGDGAAAQDLMLALRSEADSEGLAAADVWMPVDHPAADSVRAAGYDFPANDFRLAALDLEL